MVFQIVGGTGIINRSSLVLCIENAANGDDLNFSWNSVVGATYNLRASTTLDSGLSAFDIVQEGITANAPTNTLTLPRPADATTFYVIEEVPQTHPSDP